jgi:hypothetical protein
MLHQSDPQPNGQKPFAADCSLQEVKASRRMIAKIRMVQLEGLRLYCVGFCFDRLIQ